MNKSKPQQTKQTLTFNDDHTTGLIGAMAICGYARIFARIAGLTIDYLHRYHTVRRAHRVLVLAQLPAILVPFDRRHRFAAQTAQQLARVTYLHDTRPQ